MKPISNPNRLGKKGSVETFGAPRRLVAIAREVILKQDDITQEILGPPKSVAYDAVGQPTRAAQSFAEKQRTTIDKLSIVPTPKGEYLAVKKVIVGRPSKDLLAQIIPQAIRELSFPRSMYWRSASDLRFIRPIRWIVAVLDGKVVQFTLAGVTSGNATSGHRFLGKREIKVENASEFIDRLRRNFVLAHPEERRKKIETSNSMPFWDIPTGSMLLLSRPMAKPSPRATTRVRFWKTRGPAPPSSVVGH